MQLVSYLCMCICVYVYVCIYVCVHVCMYVCVNVCICVVSDLHPFLPAYHVCCMPASDAFLLFVCFSAFAVHICICVPLQEGLLLRGDGVLPLFPGFPYDCCFDCCYDCYGFC